MLALVVLMAILLVWGLVAGRLARWSITAPLAMVIAGIGLTYGSSPVIALDLDAHGVEHGVEVVLAILLFVDATESPGGVLGREPKLTLRLLLIALPLSAGLAIVAGYLVLPGQSWWLLALLATVTIPTDLAPAAAVIRDTRVPARLRGLLNVESGLNDGVVAPFFLFCLAAAKAEGRGSEGINALIDAVPAVLIAIGVGLLVGRASGWLLAHAFRRGWTQPTALRMGVLALPLLAYGLALVAGGNGFVAAFIAGVFFSSAARRLPHDALHLAEDVGMVLSLAVWFLLGALVNEAFAAGIDLRVVLYAALLLTVVRIMPVMLAVAGSGIGRGDAAFLGWLGPRGLATIVFGLLAFIDLKQPANDLVAEVMVATVLLSVVAHGLSLGPLASWYGRGATKRAREARAGLEAVTAAEQEVDQQARPAAGAPDDDHPSRRLLAVPASGEVGDRVDRLDHLLTVVEGTGIADLDGVSRPVAPGDVIAVPAGTRHNVRNTGTEPLRLYDRLGPP